MGWLDIGVTGKNVRSDEISLNRFRDKNPIAGRRKAQIAVAIYVQGNEYRLQPFTIGNCRFKDLLM